MSRIFAAHSPFRIFGLSGLITLAGLAGVLFALGLDAAIVTLILIAIEIAFSFDNAIINAKTLGTLSLAWQKVFLTVGMVIAVLGMRVVFPILIVSLSAHLSWANVIDLALHHPTEYAEKLEAAHPAIAAFGGAFLLLLALEFFVTGERKVLWLRSIERPLQKIDKIWVPATLSVLIILAMAAVPANHNPRTTIVAGILGIATHVTIQLATHLFERLTTRPTAIKNSGKGLTGMAAFSTFIYLEILDASFSFDGVIGAFAVTSKVILIAIGLGIGALWVRSLTVFMVRKQTLDNYIYLEHGAHYTVIVLAFILLLSIFLSIPDVVAGALGIGFITASVIASRQVSLANKK